MAPFLLLIGAGLVIAGTVILFWPAALIVFGLTCIAVAFDIRSEVRR